MGLEFAYLKLRSWNRYMKLWGWNLSISSYGLEFEYLKLRGWRGSNSSYINDSYALGVSPLFGGLLVTPAVSCRGWWHHGDSQHWLLQKWSMESWRLDEQLHFSWGWAAHHVTRKEKSCSCYVAVAVVLFGHGNTWSCILLMSIWINIDINLINGWQTNTNRFFPFETTFLDKHMSASWCFRLAKNGGFGTSCGPQLLFSGHTSLKISRTAALGKETRRCEELPLLPKEKSLPQEKWQWFKFR